MLVLSKSFLIYDSNSLLSIFATLFRLADFVFLRWFLFYFFSFFFSSYHSKIHPVTNCEAIKNNVIRQENIGHFFKQTKQQQQQKK